MVTEWAFCGSAVRIPDLAVGPAPGLPFVHRCRHSRIRRRTRSGRKVTFRWPGLPLHLVKAAVADANRSAIEALYRSHGDRIWRAAWAFAHDSDVASDAVAEAFAQALARGDAITSPAAWI